MGRNHEVPRANALALLKESSTNTLKAQGKDESSEEEDRHKWLAFLIPGERIVMSGLLKKRAHWFSTTQRRFLLTEMQRDVPGARILARLIYIDESKMVYRGEVPWSGEIRTVVKDKQQFEVITPRNTFQ